MIRHPYRTAPRDEPEKSRSNGIWTELIVALLLIWFAFIGSEPSGSWFTLGGLTLLVVPVLGLFAIMHRRRG